MLVFKVLDGSQSCHGGTAKWVMGRWMPMVKVDPCNSGYHLCRPQDLVHWLGKDIYLAEAKGNIIECDDKIVAEQARIIKHLDAWNDKTARLFACWCARKIWRLLKDERSRNAVWVAERFARGKATQEELSAARSAARSAAESAAWSAAWSAAELAARSAARSAQTKKLMRVLGIEWKEGRG